MPVSRAICKILYTFCKIRGEKVIVRFFSTETRHLELLLSAIESGDQSTNIETTPEGSQDVSKEDGGASAQQGDAWDWEERYITLLWLSQLLLAPFDLASISSEESRNMRPREIAHLEWPENVPALTLRVVPLAIRYLSSSGKESASAKLLLVRVAMRRDMQELGIFSALVKWALLSLNSFSPASPSSTYHYISILSFVGGLLVSSVGTTIMKPYLLRISLMMEKIFNEEDTKSYAYAIKQSPVARKAIVKILRQASVLALQDPEADESEDIIQNSIGILLDMLSDTTTHVRLAVSKALSVIAVKLDHDQASQVVDAVLEGLEKNALSLSSTVHKSEDLSRVDQNEWHGLIMTLSHLLYRHSIPAEDLPRIIEALRRGLSFEQRSLTGVSVGINVRDAANFGIWSLARRYSTAELQGVATQSSDLRWDDQDIGEVSVLQSLASELVISASLDPAGNVRRGSSAALQELIGRHPNVVENGIAVVQVVDYHAVALRSRAIREVAPKAAILSRHYRTGLLTGLMGWRGVEDADAAARRDAAFAVGRILWGYGYTNEEYDPLKNLSCNTVLIESRLHDLAPREVETRHGIILCLAEILSLIFPDCSECFEIGRICLGHTSISPLDGAPSRLLPNLIFSMYTVLKLIGSKPSVRRPELIAEAMSKFMLKGLPLLVYDSLPNVARKGTAIGMYSVPNRSMSYTLEHLTLTPPGSSPSPEIISMCEQNITQYMKRDFPDAIGAVSTAASTLLLYVSPERREALSTQWIAQASADSTEGATYIHTLFKLLGTHIIDTPALHPDSLIDSVFKRRWNARKPSVDLNIRETILDCIASTKLSSFEIKAFIPLICEGLDDFTTTARGDVGSKLRVAAAKAAGTFITTPNTNLTAQIPDLRPGELELFGMVIRAAAEKLDKVRVEGQKALIAAMLRRADVDWDHDTIENDPSEAEETDFRISRKKLSSKCDLSCSSKNWFACLLDFQLDNWWTGGLSWSTELMAGFVTSAGAGSEDVVRASRAALVEFSDPSVRADIATPSHSQESSKGSAVSSGREHGTANLNLVCSSLVQLLKLKVEIQDERVLVPTLEVLAFLFDMRIVQRSIIE